MYFCPYVWLDSKLSYSEYQFSNIISDSYNISLEAGPSG